MIRIDDRTGSKEFRPLLVRLGAPCLVARMASADFRFWGYGPRGRTRVGIERKTVDEMTAIFGSDRQTRRFIGRQLPLLVQTYPEFPILIVEGQAGVDREGSLDQGWRPQHGPNWHRPTAYLTYLQVLASLTFRARVTVLPTRTKLETAWHIRALYAWFSKPWHQHKSVIALSGVRLPPDPNLLEPRGKFREFAAGIPGVEWERSARAERYFRSPSEMVTASPEEWQRALGYKKGMRTARAIHAWCYRQKGE